MLTQKLATYLRTAYSSNVSITMAPGIVIVIALILLDKEVDSGSGDLAGLQNCNTHIPIN